MMFDRRTQNAAHSGRRVDGCMSNLRRFPPADNEGVGATERGLDARMGKGSDDVDGVNGCITIERDPRTTANIATSDDGCNLWM